MRIEPTVGRVVHIITPHSNLPRAGIITRLFGGDNIEVFDCNAIHHHQLTLIQEGDVVPTGVGYYAVWMPFQKGQAMKTEELERKLLTPGPIMEVGKLVYPELVAQSDIGKTPPAFVGTLNEAVTGLTAPHITAADVNAAIVHVTYSRLPAGRSIICEIILQNGFTVRGESSVLRIENFKQDVGMTLAYQDAWKKIWPLLAYHLAQQLHDQVRGDAGGNKIA